METHIFTVYDSAASRFLEPFCAPTIEFAMREFKTAANQEGHQFAKYPSDYTLFHIGQFDAEKGKVEGKDPISLGLAITFVDTPFSGDPDIIKEAS